MDMPGSQQSQVGRGRTYCRLGIVRLGQDALVRLGHPSLLGWRSFSCHMKSRPRICLLLYVIELAMRRHDVIMDGTRVFSVRTFLVIM